MQGIHVFRRKMTSQLIKYTHGAQDPTRIQQSLRKWEHFLELERKLGLKPQSPSMQFRPSQPVMQSLWGS